VVKGDTATIVGRDKAFVYGGKDPTDPGKPFLTLHPGDRYNLGTRHVTHRASEDSPVRAALIDSLFQRYTDRSLGGAAVLVARNGEVFVDTAFGIPPQPKYMPTTTVPQFSLGKMSHVFASLCDQLPPPAPPGRGRGGAANTNTPFQNCVQRSIGGAVGLHKTSATPEGDVQSDVDELYRVELGLEYPRSFTRDTSAADGAKRVDFARGWQVGQYHGVTRWSAFGAPDGKRSAFVRYPDKHAVIIVLTNDDSADVKAIADRMSDRLLK
jgi:hypothetical protein